MKLVLPEETITWSKRGSQSTLDLIFLSKELEDAVICCQPASELEASSDHIPITTQLSIQSPLKEEPVPYRQWKKANWEEFNKRLETGLIEMRANHEILDSRQIIDYRVTCTTETIQKIISQTMPYARPSRFAKPYWTTQRSEAVKETRKAWRKWKKVGTEES